MGRKGLWVATWIGTTALATGVAWVAVGEVADQVGPPAALPLPTAQVPTESAVTEQATAPALSGERNQPTAQDDPKRRPPRPATGPRQTQAPAQPPPAEPPPEPEPEPEVQLEPAPRTEGYALRGGSVTVQYREERVRLVQVTPNSGFAAEVNDAGPSKVDVRFRSATHESRFAARVRDGQPEVEREERPR